MSNKSRFRKQAATAGVVAAGAVLACMSSAAFAAVPAGKAGEPIVTGPASRYGGPTQFRPSFSVPSLKTSFAIGGYVRLDAYYDMDRDFGLAPSPFHLQNTAGPQPAETDGLLGMQVAESRFNLRSSTQTDIGQIDTVFEFDLFPGATQGGDLNLRHAFGEVGNFLFGHTWTNSWMTIGSVRTVKYGGMPGGSWASRQPQIRYTMDLPNKSLFAVALEDADELPTAFTGPVPAVEDSQLPDLTARYEFGRLVGVSALVRQFDTEDNGSATGFGVNLQAGYQVLPSTKLSFSGWYGEGVASYVPGGATAGNNSLKDAYIGTDGDIELVKLAAVSVGVHQEWTRTLSSDLGYTIVKQDDDTPSATGLLTEQTQYAQVSLWWEPVPRFALATEYQWSENENQNGLAIDASRITTSAIMQF